MRQRRWRALLNDVGWYLMYAFAGGGYSVLWAGFSSRECRAFKWYFKLMKLCQSFFESRGWVGKANIFCSEYREPAYE